MACEEHRNEESMCYCDGKDKTANLKSICCDYCFVWYHTKCEGVKNTQEIKSYKCTRCVSWSDKLDKLILPTLESKQSDEILFSKTEEE